MATHIEDFAFRLREMKDRSGRSYGQLAARLHLSTSTLHRYCNGAAVPADYAPVERLARLCDATPEELIALHRSWLLADAARREPQRPGPAPSAPAPPLPPPDAPAAEPAGPDRSRRPRRVSIALGAVAAAAVIATACVLPLHRPGAHSAGKRPVAVPSSASASPAADPAPVQVDVLSDNWDAQCGQWFLIDHTPAEVPRPPSLEQTTAWATALGGIPADDLRLQLTVQAAPGQQVVLHALYVHVVNRTPAPTGGYGYTPGSGCGGGLEPSFFAADLDADTPRTKPVTGFDDNGERAKPSDFPYLVSTKDPQVFDVDAATAAQNLTWYLTLVWSVGNRQGSLRIDDHGHPFRTVGLHGLPTYGYNGTEWTPSPAE